MYILVVLILQAVYGFGSEEPPSTLFHLLEDRSSFGELSSSAFLLQNFNLDLQELEPIGLSIAKTGTHSLQILYDATSLDFSAFENGLNCVLYLNGSEKERQQSDKGWFQLTRLCDGEHEIVVVAQTIDHPLEIVAFSNFTIKWQYEGHVMWSFGGGIDDRPMHRPHWFVFPAAIQRQLPPLGYSHHNTSSATKVLIVHPLHNQSLFHFSQMFLVISLMPVHDLSLYLYIDNIFAMRTSDVPELPLTIRLPKLRDGSHDIMIQARPQQRPDIIMDQHSISIQVALERFSKNCTNGIDCATLAKTMKRDDNTDDDNHKDDDDDTVTVIWCMSAIPWEADWVRFLMQHLHHTSIVDTSLTTFAPNALVVISENEERNRQGHLLASYLEEFKQRGYRVGLLHLSDEILSANDVYLYFWVDYIIRMYYSPSLVGLGLKMLTVPLGYKTGFSSVVADATLPTASRQYNWCFAGQISNKISRFHMMKHARNVKGGFERLTQQWNDNNGLSTSDYALLLQQCKATLCPNGNLSPETFRIYEALEAGSIPIIVNDTYFAKVLGSSHPLLHVQSDWSDLSEKMETIINNPERANEIQRQILTWWKGFKESLHVPCITRIKRMHLGQKWILQQLIEVQREQARPGGLLQHIMVRVDEANVFLWHVIFVGPTDTPYAKGIYHCTILFPVDAPMSPPSFRMLTPNGRFKVGARICSRLASDFHPESHNCILSVVAILRGFYDLWLDDGSFGLGSIATEVTIQEKRELAAKTWQYNETNADFVRYFSKDEEFHRFLELLDTPLESINASLDSSETETVDSCGRKVIGISQEAMHQRGLICQLCKKIVTSPVQIAKCGHMYCKACVEEYYLSSKCSGALSRKQCPQNCCASLQIRHQLDVLNASHVVDSISVQCKYSDKAQLLRNAVILRNMSPVEWSRLSHLLESADLNLNLNFHDQDCLQFRISQSSFFFFRIGYRPCSLLWELENVIQPFEKRQSQPCSGNDTSTALSILVSCLLQLNCSHLLSCDLTPCVVSGELKDVIVHESFACQHRPIRACPSAICTFSLSNGTDLGERVKNEHIASCPHILHCDIVQKIDKFRESINFVAVDLKQKEDSIVRCLQECFSLCREKCISSFAQMMAPCCFGAYSSNLFLPCLPGPAYCSRLIDGSIPPLEQTNFYLVPDHFESISKALSVATEGSLVIVRPGVYVESIKVPAGVTLQGTSLAGVTIHSGETPVEIEPGGVIQQLTIVQDSQSNTPAIRLSPGGEVCRCHVESHGNGVGIYVIASLTDDDVFQAKSLPLVAVIKDCTLSANNSVVCVASSLRLWICGCILRMQSLHGLVLDPLAQATICDSMIYGSGANARNGVVVSEAAAANLQRNVILSVSRAIEVSKGTIFAQGNRILCCSDVGIFLDGQGKFYMNDISKVRGSICCIVRGNSVVEFCENRIRDSDAAVGFLTVDQSKCLVRKNVFLNLKRGIEAVGTCELLADRNVFCNISDQGMFVKDGDAVACFNEFRFTKSDGILLLGKCESVFFGNRIHHSMCNGIVCKITDIRQHEQHRYHPCILQANIINRVQSDGLRIVHGHVVVACNDITQCHSSGIVVCDVSSDSSAVTLVANVVSGNCDFGIQIGSHAAAMAIGNEIDQNVDFQQKPAFVICDGASAVIDRINLIDGVERVSVETRQRILRTRVYLPDEPSTQAFDPLTNQSANQCWAAAIGCPFRTKNAADHTAELLRHMSSCSLMRILPAYSAANGATIDVLYSLARIYIAQGLILSLLSQICVFSSAQELKGHDDVEWIEIYSTDLAATIDDINVHRPNRRTRVILSCGIHALTSMLWIPPETVVCGESKYGTVLKLDDASSPFTISPTATLKRLTVKHSNGSGVALRLTQGGVIDDCLISSDQGSAMEISSSSEAAAAAASTSSETKVLNSDVSCKMVAVTIKCNADTCIDSCVFENVAKMAELSDGSHLKIRRCLIRECQSTAIVATSGSKLVMQQCDLTHNHGAACVELADKSIAEISNCRFDSNSVAVLVSKNSRAVVTQNEFHQIRRAVEANASSFALITKNVISKCSNIALCALSGCKIEVESNDISDVEGIAGIFVSDSSTGYMRGNSIHDSKMAVAVYFHTKSQGIVEDCFFTGMRRGIETALQSNVQVSRNFFMDCSSTAVLVSGSFCRIDYNIMAQVQGNGCVYVAGDDGNVDVESNEFHHNETDVVVFLESHTSANISNNQIWPRSGIQWTNQSEALITLDNNV